MADGQLFTRLRVRQQAAVFANQQAQLLSYGRVVAELRAQNRELKKELRRARSGRSTLSRRFASKLRRKTADVGKLVQRSEPRDSESGESQEGPSPEAWYRGYSVAADLIRDRFDGGYYARVRGLKDDRLAWDDYLDRGLATGAAINAAHAARLEECIHRSDPVDMWIAAVHLRYGSEPLLARRREVDIARELRDVASTLDVAGSSADSRLNALRALVARYCPDLNPSSAAEEVVELCARRAAVDLVISVRDAAPSDFSCDQEAAMRWGVILAAIALTEDAPRAWGHVREALTSQRQASLIDEVRERAGTWAAHTNEVHHIAHATAPVHCTGAFEVDSLVANANVDVVAIVAETLGLCSTAGHQFGDEVRTVAAELVASVRGRRIQTDTVLAAAQEAVVKELVGPSRVVADLYFGSRSLANGRLNGTTRHGALAPTRDWLVGSNPGQISAALSRSGWPSGYLTWRPVRALREESFASE